MMPTSFGPGSGLMGPLYSKWADMVLMTELVDGFTDNGPYRCCASGGEGCCRLIASLDDVELKLTSQCI